MSRSMYEQEVIINWNREEDTASVYTADKNFAARMDKLMQKSPDIKLIKSNSEQWEYLIPKKWVKIKMPRQLSEENRQKAADRARLNFGKSV